MNRLCTAAFGLMIAASISSCVCSVGAGVALPEEPSTFLYDAPDAPGATLAETWLSKQLGWSRLAEDNTAHRFSGSAVFLNDKIVAVLAKDSPLLEVYSRHTEGMRLCARLQPICEGRADLKRTYLPLKRTPEPLCRWRSGLLRPPTSRAG